MDVGRAIAAENRARSEARQLERVLRLDEARLKMAGEILVQFGPPPVSHTEQVERAHRALSQASALFTLWTAEAAEKGRI